MSLIKPVSTLGRSAKSLAESRSAVLSLYRYVCKKTPWIINIYDLNIAPAEVRRSIGNMFRKNADVKDPRTVNMMVSRGYMELEETLAQFKQKSHVVNMLQKNMRLDHEKPQKTFLERFYANEV